MPRQSVGQARAAAAAQQPVSRSVKIAPAKQVRIVYQGPVGTHLVPSPLRLTRTYGLHTRGDSFEVYAADQQAKPQIFVLTEAING